MKPTYKELKEQNNRLSEKIKTLEEDLKKEEAYSQIVAEENMKLKQGIRLVQSVLDYIAI